MKSNTHQTSASQPVPDDGLTEEEEHDDAIIGRAFRWSLAVFTAIGVGVGVFVWANHEVELQIDPVQPVEPPRIIVDTIPLPSVPFEDRTDSAGITFVHESGASGEKLLPESMGGGCSVVDYDGDGDPDILFVNSKRWDHDLTRTTAVDGTAEPATLSLWRNESDWTFTDVTRESGLEVSMYGMGAAVGDFDNDGTDGAPAVRERRAERGVDTPLATHTHFHV